MSGTAFDAPVEDAAEEAYVSRSKVITTGGQVYEVSQKATTVLRYAREALSAGEEVKRPFFVTLDAETGKLIIAAKDIAVIEAL